MMAMPSFAQRNATLTVHPSQGSVKIDRNIYGQFAEHLGTCIYGGLWVGEESSIPNTNGYRNDVFQALKDLHVPVLRWPGGCFGDKYHWTEGIGPRSERPKKINSWWGGTIEDNSFGTHEFLNLCEMLGCQPYVSLNVGSGTVQECADWIEYMTAANGPMAELRAKNGRKEPWKVKYIGVGNESWGCGGNMRPEYYSDVYRRYNTYCTSYDGNQLCRIACGANSGDFNWTDVVMSRAARHMDALSLHYYTGSWKGERAADFDDVAYYGLLGKCLYMDQLITRHSEIMDRYDHDKRVGLFVDEWGTWFSQEEGSVPGHLYQQNTMRDAMIAALTFGIFHQHADRVRMCNIAQIVNVLQSMILTKDDKMVLTPTYYVFKMFVPHQDATFVPSELTADEISCDDGKVKVKSLFATSSKDENGLIHVSLANVDLAQKQTLTLNLDGVEAAEVTGTILAADDIHAHNTFENPDQVKAVEFKDAKIEKKDKSKLTVVLPEKSIVTLEITPRK